MAKKKDAISPVGNAGVNPHRRWKPDHELTPAVQGCCIVDALV